MAGFKHAVVIILGSVLIVTGAGLAVLTFVGLLQFADNTVIYVTGLMAMTLGILLIVVQIASARSAREIPKTMSGKADKLAPYLLGLLFILVGSYIAFIGLEDGTGREQHWIATLAGWFFLLVGITACAAPLLITKDPGVVLTPDKTHRLIKPVESPSTLIILWMFTILLGVLSVIFWKVMLSLEQTDWLGIGVAAFLSAILLFIFYLSVHTSLGVLRFGFMPLMLPVQHNENERQFSASMQIKRTDIVKHVSLRLICYKLAWEKKKDARNRLGFVLTRTEHWQDSNHDFRPTTDGTVNIVFTLPADIPGTTGTLEMAYREADFGKTFYAWQLEVKAEVPGVDLLRLYEVPVAATA